MGSETNVSSEQGKGSVFSFHVRLAIPDSSAPMEASNAAAAVPSNSATPPHTLDILLAEDSPYNALLIEQMLSPFGHRVHAVASGTEALKKQPPQYPLTRRPTFPQPSCTP